MILRVEPAEARGWLAAEIASLGVLAHAVGETLDLTYPEGGFTSAEHVRTEALFFIRSWAAADQNIEAEVVG